MYEIEISIQDLSGTGTVDFQEAATALVQKLQSAPGLDTSVGVKTMPGTRGAAVLLSGIIATGIQLGAFSAIYVLAKDLFAVHSNAEVELKFKDGSMLKLKNLTQHEAETAINEHLLESTRKKRK